MLKRSWLWAFRVANSYHETASRPLKQSAAWHLGAATGWPVLAVVGGGSGSWAAFAVETAIQRARSRFGQMSAPLDPLVSDQIQRGDGGDPDVDMEDAVVPGRSERANGAKVVLRRRRGAAREIATETAAFEADGAAGNDPTRSSVYVRTWGCGKYGTRERRCLNMSGWHGFPCRSWHLAAQLPRIFSALTPKFKVTTLQMVNIWLGF